jgi:biopolymer transport protein ExbD
VTPLMDVVFIMLIFFVVTASFVRESSIDLARFDSPVTSESSANKKNILIAIDANGRLWINRRPISLDALAPNIEAAHAENPGAKVIVMAAPDSLNGLLVSVVDTARQIGIADVSLAAPN